MSKKKILSSCLSCARTVTFEPFAKVQLIGHEALAAAMMADTKTLYYCPGCGMVRVWLGKEDE